MDILLKGYKYEIVNLGKERKIEKIEIDSRKAKKGNLFICIEGEKYDSHRAISECYKKGVRVFVTSKKVKIEENDITIIKVEDTRDCLAYVNNIYFGNLSEKFEIVGVTGTNGKTSTTYYIEKILSYAENKVGTIGTLGIKINSKDVKLPFETSTTPDAIDMQKIYSKFLEEEVKKVVAEISSHGLKQNRVNYTKFKVGIFTNLTQDHLDFHNTFEDYYESKKKLFDMCEIGIINIDNKYGKRLSSELKEERKCKVIEISINEKSDYKAENIKLIVNKLSYDVIIDEKVESIKIDVPGDFTVYNTLMAILCCRELGISIEVIKEGLKKIKGVPGRIEPVINDKNLNVFVDYAHTPNALEMVIKAIKRNTKGRVITVFGCGGDRDVVKRPIMGSISSKYSDITIVTSDNPRTENKQKIVDDILKGINSNKENYSYIDRDVAIKKAIEIATPEDSVIIAGKGHEDYQIIGEKKYHFSDYETAMKVIGGL